MSFVNTDLQEKNKKLNMKVDLDGSAFQRILDKISNSDLYKNEFFTSSFQHNIYHIQRVMFFSQIIAQNEGISERDLKLLLLAAALHDSGKTRDRRDGEHGKNGAKIAEEYLQNNINTISKEDIKIIQIAIEYHTIREEEKGKVNQEFALAVLNSNYKYDNLINNDTVKTLSNVRKRFFEENTITKKERLFPVRIVKKIFEDALFGRTNYKTQGEIKYRNCGRLYIGGTGDMFLCKNKSMN